MAEEGFEAPSHFRIPNLGDGVVKDGVEIRTVDTVIGTQIIIVLPLNVREDKYFVKTTQGPLMYMKARKYIYLKTPDDIETCLDQIKTLTQFGAAIIFYNQDKVFDCSWDLKQEEERKKSPEYRSKQVIAKTEFFAFAIGVLLGWHNLKTLTDLLSENEIIELNETISKIIQMFAEQEINSEHFGENALLRILLGLGFSTTAGIIASTIAKIHLAIKKRRQK